MALGLNFPSETLRLGDTASVLARLQQQGDLGGLSGAQGLIDQTLHLGGADLLAPIEGAVRAGDILRLEGVVAAFPPGLRGPDATGEVPTGASSITRPEAALDAALTASARIVLAIGPQAETVQTEGHAFQVVGRYVYPVCPACAASKFDAQTTRRLRQTAALLVVALTLHSVMDGVAVAVGGALHGAGSDVPLLWAVSLHKLPEGLALASLLLSAGYSAREALLLTAGVEMTTFIGGLLGAFFLAGISPFWLGALLAHVGGGFLYLVLHTLRGRTGRAFGEAASQIGYGTLGFASVALLLWGLHRLE